MNPTLVRLLLLPSVLPLALWMVVPLLMTIYFSLTRFNLLQPDQVGFAGFENFVIFVTDPSFFTSMVNTLWLLGSVIAITVVLGVLIALLIQEPFAGRGIVRLLLISPFFVMPTVNALLWKNMMMNPIYGVLAQMWQLAGASPVDWLTDWPLLSIVIMVSWQWLPFATLIFITALQSLDREQLEAARMDGANHWQQVRHLYLPHIARSVVVVIMVELIFLLSMFAEIFTTTGGGPGDASTNMAFLILRNSCPRNRAKLNSRL